MTASLNEIYKAIGSLETAVKGLAAKIDESDQRADASKRADEHRATVHRRVDELVGEVGSRNTRLPRSRVSLPASRPTWLIRRK